MNLSATWRRHRSLRWLVPVGVAGVISLVVTVSGTTAPATRTRLPRTTPAALLAQVRTAGVAGFSGTVVSSLSLGLPSLSGLTSVGLGDGSSIASLLSGSHTLQVWYGGADKQRVALFGATDETDLFHNGRDLWRWDSATRTAVHVVLSSPRYRPGSGQVVTLLPSSITSTTPGEVARGLVRELDPTTAVRVVSGVTVADRSAYELVLTPRRGETLIGSVRIAIDGATKTPLAVRVFARDDRTPAVDVAFSSIRFGRPAERNFAFAPPPDAAVRTVTSGPARGTGNAARAATRAASPEVLGAGWTRVLSAPLPPDASLTRAAPLLRSLTPVTGTWGSGRLLRSALLSVLVTDSGRVYAGAVDPAALYSAAANK